MEKKVEKDQEIIYNKVDNGKYAKEDHRKFLTGAINAMTRMVSVYFSINEAEPSRLDLPNRIHNELSSVEIEPNKDSIEKAWNKIGDLAKELKKGCSLSIGDLPSIKEFMKNANGYAQEFKEGKIDRKEYSKKIREVEEEIAKKGLDRDNLRIIKTGEYIKAATYLEAAISKYKTGALILIKNLDDKYLNSISDSMKGILGEKKITDTSDTGSDAKEKRRKELEKPAEPEKNNESRVYESIGDFVKKAKGIAREVADKTGLSNQELKSPNKASIDNQCQTLYSTLVSISSEINNIILSFDDDVKRNEYRESASDIISKVKSSRNKIEEIRKELPKASPDDLKRNEAELKDIQELVTQMLDPRAKGDNVFNKWKGEVLGNSEVTIANEFYEKGKELVDLADGIISKIIDRRYYSNRMRETDSDVRLEKLARSFSNTKGGEELPSRVSKEAYATFSESPTKEEGKTVAKFQGSLKKAGIAGKEMKDGEYDDATKKAVKKAIPLISKLTGKTYSETGGEFKDFQQDFRVYSDNLGIIRKRLGVN